MSFFHQYRQNICNDHAKNKIENLQLEESFDNGREIILLKILKRFKGKTVRTLPKNIQKK